MRKKKEPQEPQKTWPESERRKESRLQEEDKIIVEPLSDISLPSGKKFFNALTKDISPGGVRIITNVLLPVDTLVKIEIALSKRRKLIDVTAKVRWARSVYEEELFEMGLEFIHISPEDKMSLLEHTYGKK